MPARLTKYEILGALASGGMADVWLARVSGPQGFDKLVVVKTIRPNLAQDAGFVEMFFNEARIAAMLNHPNCVQIFDVGDEGGISYIAMEFIDGFSLSRMLKRSETMRIPLPADVVARICMDAAAGLDHAHNLVDRHGNPLRLVHRDISPDNVLVGFSGQTKVVDFGIAKAVSPRAPGEGTRTGTLKGKFGYMAPEYLSGLPIDGRADLFALGVVMYRALTGQKAFNGVTEALVSNAVLNATPTSPRVHNPLLPVALETVIMTSLEKIPARRFENARVMRKAIERAIERPADSDDVAAVMEQLWPQADAERGKVRALAAGLASEQSGPVLDSVASASVEVDVTMHTATSQVSSPAAPPPAPAASSRAPLLAGVAAMLLVVGAGAAWFVTRGGPPSAPPVAPVAEAPTAPAEPTPPVAPEPPAAPEAPPAPAATGPGKVEVSAPVPMEVSVDGKVLGRTPGTFELPAGAQVLKFQNKDLGTRQLTVTVVSGETVKARAPVGKGSIDIRVSPWASVKIDGRAVGDTPLPPQDVLEGRHVVELSNAKLGKKKRVVVTVSPGERQLVRETMD